MFAGVGNAIWNYMGNVILNHMFVGDGLIDHQESIFHGTFPRFVSISFVNFVGIPQMGLSFAAVWPSQLSGYCNAHYAMRMKPSQIYWRRERCDLLGGSGKKLPGLD